jgi:CO dehydrogenase maturation factor
VKIAVAGKGGVGKSTFVALAARVLRDSGKRVIVIDADPDMSMSAILGIPDSRKAQPIVELEELIAERTLSQEGKFSPFYKMNPKVDDIPERFWVEFEGLRLLVMGTVKKGGGGCACPENTFLKALLMHLLLGREEWVLLDMEAGIEHLGRGTAMGVDEMVVVVEPSQTSIETAQRIGRLSKDIRIKKLSVIGNKIMEDEDRRYLSQGLEGFDILGFVDYAGDLKKINRRQESALTVNGNAVKQVSELLSRAGWV